MAYVQNEKNTHTTALTFRRHILKIRRDFSCAQKIDLRKARGRELAKRSMKNRRAVGLLIPSVCAVKKCEGRSRGGGEKGRRL